MEHNNFVGRIGALAVALGVGSAIAAPAGIAWANPDTTSDAPSAGDHGADGSTNASAPAAGSTPSQDGASAAQPDGSVDSTSGTTTTSATTDADKGSSETVEVAPGVKVSSSGGPHTSTYDTTSNADDEPTDGVTGQADPSDHSNSTATRATSPSHNKFRDSGTPSDTALPSALAPKPTPPTLAHDSGRTTIGDDGAAAPILRMSATAPPTGTVTAPQLSVSTAPTIVTPPAPSPIETTIAVVLRNVVAPVLSTFLAALQRGLTESPLSWMLLAAARREVGTEAVAEAAPATMRMAATQIVAAAVVNQAPTAVGTFSTTNALTGAVTGQVVATDPEGVTPTITLTTKPALGTLVYNTTAATFTYTPTAAQRILAGTTPWQATTVAMTVTVSDGVNKVPVQINIPVSAVVIGVRADVAGVGGAGAVAATNTRAYVTNRDAGTVTVIDTVTAKVIGTYAVGAAPDGVAVKQDGTRLYVSSSTGNTVKVIDTATGAVTATIAVAKPTAITMAPGGASIYVTSYDTAKVLRISTATNTVATTTTLPTGYRPTGIAASPDNTRVYVTTDTPTGGTAVLTFGPTSTTATQLTQLANKATSLTVSPDDGRLYVGSDNGTVSVIDTKTRALIGAIQTGGLPTAALAVSGDGSTLIVTDAAGRIGAFNAANGGLFVAIATRPTNDISQSPGAVVSPDGTELYVTDRPAGVVHVISLTAPNANPVAGTPTKSAPNATTGAITGTVGVTDPNGDPLSYTVSGAPTKGSIVLGANGTFTYTPTAVARHAASTVGAPSSVTTDSFTVTVTDGRRGVVTTTITVGVSPTNTVPTVTKTVGSPNSATGVVTGTVTGVDADKDVITYTSSVPTKGSVTLTATGAFTYTPTATARHAAQKLDATAADKQDTFTVAVNDGHGGVVTTSVTVSISPTNTAPTGGNATVTQVNSTTGAVTGVLSAVDLDGDKLTFTSATPQKGTLTIGANGSYTYTPTSAARDAASAPNAAPATKSEAIAITVADGYGGTATFTLTAAITPYMVGNHAPVIGTTTVGSSSAAIGTVTGKITATDPDGDALTYTVTAGPTKGVLKVDAATGAYTYTPTVDARYTALVTPGVDTDVFTVTVKDALGASTTASVSVTIVPPAANSVDQRATSVAIHVPDLLFYSQAEIDTALDKLQSLGVTDIRVLVPWAAVEPVQGWTDWSAVDRVINSAAARNIKVLGILNSAPTWAAVPNTFPLAGMPADNAQFAAFAGLAAARYKGKVTAWEVWNEPNAIMFWQPGPNAAQYTALLKPTYLAIKAADPDAVVVAASVGATLDWGGLTVNPVRFVSEMYDAGAAGYFDALSFHPYQYTTPFTQGGIYYESPLTQVNRIYALMVPNGDGNKKIWATEYGEPSSAAGDANQAAYLADFLRGWRTLSFAGPAFIHTLVDNANADPAEASFGLFNPDWTPKPSAATVITVIAENDAIEAAKYVIVL
jgi:YVTN family beta-propeller protein/VCBS repeat-containing protein